MGKAIPTQHPAVVLRSHYRQVQAMVAIALVAVVGLSGAVVIVANEDDEPATPSSVVQFEQSPLTHAHPKEHLNGQQSAGTRYDGGPEEGTRGTVAVQPPNGRYDGSPEEGTRGPVKDYSKNAVTGDHARAPAQAPDTRYDGGPEEGSRGSSR